MTNKKHFFKFVIFWVFVLSNAQAEVNKNKYDVISIGTADVSGLYYPVGGSICRIVNKNIKKLGVRCSVQDSEGSLENLDSLVKKKNRI